MKQLGQFISFIFNVKNRLSINTARYISKANAQMMVENMRLFSSKKGWEKRATNVGANTAIVELLESRRKGVPIQTISLEIGRSFQDTSRYINKLEHAHIVRRDGDIISLR